MHAHRGVEPGAHDARDYATAREADGHKVERGALAARVPPPRGWARPPPVVAAIVFAFTYIAFSVGRVPWMRSDRLAAAIIGPDIMSQVVLAIPFILLYLLCIVSAKLLKWGTDA